MTEHKTFPGKTYCVTCAEGCTVSDSTGTLSMECEAGKQLHVTAPSDKLFTSASAIVREVFNLAPAKLKLLGLLGGGASTGLPSGYLDAEFLKNSRTQYIVLPVKFTQGSGMSIRYSVDASSSYSYLSIIRYGSSSLQFGRISTDRKTGISTTVPTSSTFVQNNGVIDASYNAYGSGTIEVASPSEESKNELVAAPSEGQAASPVYLFAYDSSENLGVYNPSLALYTLYNCVFTQASREICRLVPAISPAGQPCLYDTIGGIAYTNSGTGSFIVGMTVEQARKLSKLPSTGGALTISLPSSIVSGDTITDSAVASAVATARSKGWSITVQTYTEEATAAVSTYGFRRIWVRKTEDENGSYVDADGIRWQVDWCVTMYTPDDSTPDMHGYELFRSVEAATEYWGLTEYVDPEWEEELLTNN